MQSYGDLTGQKFNDLLAIYSKKENGKVYWWCRCNCGNEKFILNYKLKNGETKSCGCRKTNKPFDPTFIGQKFGKLVVISFSHKGRVGKSTKHFWNCKCDCGNETKVPKGALKSG